MGALHSFAVWLAHSPLNAVVTGRSWFVPEIQVVHILAIAAVVIAAALINLRALDLIATDQPPQAISRAWFPVILIALAVLALTGMLLIISEPGRAMFRTVFWVKLALIMIATTVTGAHGLTGANAPVWTRRALAIASLMLWIGVIFAGRWIAYAPGWPGAFS